MHLPKIINRSRYKREIIAFGGINYTKNYSEGDFSDGSAFSHLHFPYLTQRQALDKKADFSNPVAADFSTEECVALNEALYYNGKKVCDLKEGEKELVFMGVYVIVFPDKVYYNTETEECGNLGFSKTTKDIKVTFSSNSISVPETQTLITTQKENLRFSESETVLIYESAMINGVNISFSGESEVSVAEIKNESITTKNCLPNQYRIIVSSEKTEDGIYIVHTELIKVEEKINDFFAGLRAGDAVIISGCSKSKNNKTAIISSVDKNKLTFTESEFTSAEEAGSVRFERKIPDFSCVCAFQNRLWGCEKNTIYASKLGDPFNFFVYRELSTDSFTVSANTAGDFTACIPYGNYCLFFKENACFKLFGNRPANFQLSESFAGGIENSSRKSLATSSGRVFFKGTGGVYVFHGGLPLLISEPLGDITLKNACAGADEKYYYLSADTSSGREMFVYDIRSGLWSKWGKSDITGFTLRKGEVCVLKEDGIYAITTTPDKNEPWSVTLHPTNEKYYGKKNYSKIFIRAELFENAWIKLEISKDGSQFYTAATHHSSKKCHINIPVAIRGCNELVLRISGRGQSIIENVVREFSVS